MRLLLLEFPLVLTTRYLGIVSEGSPQASELCLLRDTVVATPRCSDGALSPWCAGYADRAASLQHECALRQGKIRPDRSVIARRTRVAGDGREWRIFVARLFRGSPDAAALDLHLFQERPKRIRNKEIINLLVLARRGVIAMRPAIRSRRQFVEGVVQARKPQQRSKRVRVREFIEIAGDDDPVFFQIETASGLLTPASPAFCVSHRSLPSSRSRGS